MLENWRRASALSLEAASPRTSRHRVKAIANMGSSDRSTRLRPSDILSANATASCMCRRRTASGFGIDDESIPQHFLPEVSAQIHRCPQIDFPAPQQTAEFILNVGQSKEADMLMRPELD